MTTENSRADALTDEKIEEVLADAGVDFYSQGNIAGAAKDLFNGVRACVILAASPSSQPAAAPIDDSEARRLARQLRMVCDDQGCRFNACDEAAEYLEARAAQPTPSSADERAAFAVWAKTKNMDLTPFETTFDSDLTSNAWDGWQARAASANETGAEGADEPSELEQVIACLGDDAAILRHADEYVEMADNMDAAARLLESRHGEILQKIGSALGLLAGDDLHRHVLPALHAVLLDAKRWRAFRGRDAFENLEYVVFQDQFREDADRIIDAAIAESDEYRAAEEMCNRWPWAHASALARAEPPTHIVDAAMDVARHEYGHGVTRSSIVAIWKALGKPWYALADDYAVVPLEPTEEMKLAGLRADDRDRQPRDQLLVQWDAMLAAVPQPAQADARVGLTADMRDVLDGNFGALEQAEDLCRAKGNDSSADGLNALSHALRALLDDDRA